jgi:uncharacterized integral membrane protein
VDALGIGEVRLRPGYPRARLEIAEGDDVRALFLRDAPTQILVRPERGLLRSDERLVATIESVRRDGTLFLDLFVEGRWISADHVRLEGARALRYEVALPPRAAGLVVLQVSTAPDGRGGAGDARAVYVDSRAETAQGLRRLIRRLARVPSADPLVPAKTPLAREPAPEALLARPPRAFARVDRDGIDRAALLLLSRVEAGPRPLPRLYDDLDTKLRRMEARKARLRRPLIVALVGLVGGVLLVAAVHVVRARRQMRQRLAALELELPDEDAAGEADADPVGRITSDRQRWQALLLLALLAAALVGLVILLETLRWNWGQ